VAGKGVGEVTGGPAPPFRPTREQLLAAEGKTVPDVISPGLQVLFCGINPGLYSGAVGHHFARPGNRFWRVIHGAGFTSRLLSPFEEKLLLDNGCGITNLVERATARAADLSPEELSEGAERLKNKAIRYRPAVVAVLGIGAYRRAFGLRSVDAGEQPLSIGPSKAWLLPNPSGLNAHYQVDEMVRIYAELRNWVPFPT
jgi:double-stranded uracil-DNA glycosylase